ncbi:hypothetical protein RND81_14G073800 [Saponaria officinalis]|uniref:ARM repeat superfamily protein n=1 Tax=Saponaria officinalis TaxID=3572 RepID=A0AAW1GM89_SAPOF
MEHRSSVARDVQLHIHKTNDIVIHEPRTTGIENRENGGTIFVPGIRLTSIEAPEKKLTLLALRLAVLEKAATGLGTLGFIWATVVLLGGFAITLGTTDFWFITVILLIEGGRIFGRSRELEWQHQATWSLADAGINSFRLLKSSSSKISKRVKPAFRMKTYNDRQIKAEITRIERRVKLVTRRWESADVPILPYASWVFVSRNISKILQWFQIMAAITCVVLSTIKIVRRNFGDIEKGDTDKRNREAALLIFYSLALAEASLFLLEKLYWELNVTYGKVLEQINDECEFGHLGIISIRRFFYDAYSRCVEGSVFDGVKMDMVSFAIELLSSNSPDEQLMGARILQSFSTSERFGDDTLQKIGTTFSSVERLVEMLNWKDPEEQNIRHASAVILLKLVRKEQNSLRVAGIPGSMESISSLLYDCRISGRVMDGIGEKSITADHEDYGFYEFNHLGLQIFKKLARDHENCGKIGSTRGLLRKIIDFTCAGEMLLKDTNVTRSQILTVKRSLQVLNMLASTTGSTGKQLRREIAENVFTVSNIRDILRHGEKHPKLQKLGIEILTNLAMEDDATERIGGTGGILRELLNIFLKNVMLESEAQVTTTAAGEALTMLASESKQNCQRILKLGALENLVEALEVPNLRVNAAPILSNLCTYSAEEYFLDLRRVTNALPTVLKMIISEDDKLQEVMVGLAARALTFTKYEESTIMFQRAEVKQTDLEDVLVQILKKYQYPPARFPRIRRFTIELAIWMMKASQSNVGTFKNLRVENELENVLDTTSELECFNIFSGTVGLSRCSTSIHSLVETALHLVEDL